MFELCVIVPTYSNWEYTFNALRSLRTDCYVVLVDDASPDWDASVEMTLKEIIPSIIIKRFSVNGGLTRSWNEGLRIAKKLDCKYVVISNNDVLYSIDWWEKLKQGFKHFDLVSCVTNAPGVYNQQNIYNYTDYNLTDKLSYIDSVCLPEQYILGKVNGFFMAAALKTWWDNAYSSSDVFNPSMKMKGNEDEFQTRFIGSIGTVVGCFIFHYRSVSRGLKHGNMDRGAYRMQRATTYTSIVNDFDTLKDNRFDGVPFVYTTDGECRRDARRDKCLSHQLDVDYSIWVDGTIKLLVHPRTLIDMMGDNDILTFRHPSRCCFMQEAVGILEHNKDSKEVVYDQVEKYLKDGMPIGYGLWETMIVVRRHNEAVKSFNEMWWNEIENRSVRDQLSFPYCVWKTGIKVGSLPGSGENSYICKYHPHKVIVPEIVHGL